MALLIKGLKCLLVNLILSKTTNLYDQFLFTPLSSGKVCGESAGQVKGWKLVVDIDKNYSFVNNIF